LLRYSKLPLSIESSTYAATTSESIAQADARKVLIKWHKKVFEHLTSKLWVGGSIPSGRANIFNSIKYLAIFQLPTFEHRAV
jgi:hypothetical protein